ncbi:uncharacterized protein LOC106464440 [Limulus polyphemus]|uniref:Uncharacterized protein LOC106464440 n=1 Tax=Limulus polyphemus TaxID=6850 RepID=A0ABM1SW60_LIMPO|nr:uncharacterized protein LOC106464440 [Limulus polyphemus]XP_022247862.1 uncharacterized protein LOC106464440 [Limulus polyphemus]XP_022247863.1 uncharacterized protein LOC106464440 [Limulus polyphemus]XP_022247864.1 uncharacterized protein LOC106464440 [Limulus polyphemus]XP_022247866.1 uncharacterized protein LOC106464440 [Limulus polyphemus]XP_022247867.1 uncharacterized protein LOC106464440 [Limulus polyphemus]
MWAILAVIFVFSFYYLLTTKALPPLHGVYSLPGRYFLLKKFVSFFYLKIRRLIIRKRFDLYDLYDLTDLVKSGCMPPAEETALEAPQTANHVATNCDEVFFCGVKSTGECLVVKMSRLPNKMAEIMVLIKTADGRRYSYPEGPTKEIYTGNINEFIGGGLELKCISAMRKWRISFNGLLRETRQGICESKVLHVKFSFIWQTMSNVYDLTNDINLSEVAEALAKEPWSGYLPDVNRFQRVLDVYEQGGQLLGSVTVEGIEEEFILWGIRKRSLGPTVQLHRCVDFFGFTKNGNLFHVGALSFPGIVTNLVYGHYIHSNGMYFHIRSCNFKLHLAAENKQIPHFERFTFKAGHKDIHCTITFETHLCNFTNRTTQQHFKYSTITMNGYQGSGISVFVYGMTKPSIAPIPSPLDIFHSQESPMINQLALDFDHTNCQLTRLAGGKGSSLGKLTKISHYTSSFVVPKGIVVTTSAYKEFIKKGNLHEVIMTLEEVAWCHVTGNLKEICERVVRDVSKTKLPAEVSEAIQKKMLLIFGGNLDNLRFAVRSSASGEDSDEMSAAGQNETFLGVRGLPQVIEAVSKCWASQFSYVAVEYKRRNGQLLNSPMAVVIQEMVPAEVAGVMFTCDPVTANPSVITISANYGLGETVVSAAAEPDTIFLDRDYTNKITYRSVSIGKKNICTVVEPDGEIKVAAATGDSSQSCLSESTALALGKVGILVEEYLTSLRDIEWAIINENIYLLQARPVTSAHTETEFEITHEMDAPLKSEDEFLSKANVGEVMPGAMSTLGLIVNLYSFEASFKQMALEFGFPSEMFSPYTAQTFSCKFNHIFYDMVSDPYLGSENNMAAGYKVALFGSLIRDKELTDRINDRCSMMNMSLPMKLRQAFVMGKGLLLGEQNFRTLQKKYADSDLPLNYKEADGMYKFIGQNILSITNKPILCHSSCSVNSMLWNTFVLNLLVSAEKEWNTKVFSDFGYLLSTCTNIESADVPSTIEKLVLDISKEIDKDEFLSMTPETASRWLSVSQSKAGEAFREFLRNHGHRCVKEFDIYSKPWAIDPTHIVQSLQTLIVTADDDFVQNKEVSEEKTISNLQVSLSWWQKLILWFLLPRVRSGVRLRESSKSFVIKKYDALRRAYNHLATLMVKEGYLPDACLLFFLTHEEIGQLLQTRSSRLISKAVRRRKIHPQLNALQFAEITRGITKPVNKTEMKKQNTSNTYIIGTPVSRGVIQGPVRVVTCLEKAVEIQPGDILVTYSTDIGWSPYFPLLSGIATELGGLISHGAVVAREYGLPCVVGLHGATSFFVSGEMVQLDGSSGRIEKLTSLEHPLDAKSITDKLS